MIGGRFGKLVVEAQAENYGTQRQWSCACDCGANTIVRTGHLTSGAVKSCGCGRGRWVHGKVYTSEHCVWTGMKARCGNPNGPEYKNYGGRGITVCQQWKDSFGAFLADVGPRPSPEHQLDRTDNNLGYSPENCRWVTRKDQCNNKRDNVHLIIEGKTKTRTQWANQYGIHIETLRYRLSRGETPLSALTRPPLKMRGKNC